MKPTQRKSGAFAPFRYDIVGSFLRPARLKEAREQFAAGDITREQLTLVEDEEIVKLVAKQKELGLKAVTDGEFRRRWWHHDFLAELEGMTAFQYKMDGFGGETSVLDGTYVSTVLGFPDTHPFLEHFRFTQQAAGDTLVKQTIPGPNMIYASSILRAPQYQAQPVYATFEEIRDNLAKVYQDAIAAFYNAGCRYLQMDDTSWGALLSDKFLKGFTDLGYTLEQLVDEFRQIMVQALEGRPNDMTITFHMCKGNFKSTWLYEGYYDRIASALFSIEGIDGFFLEYDDERSGDFSPLALLGTQKAVLGLITTKTPALEPEEILVERIKKAAEYAPLEQLCVSPQCGFSSTEEGNHLTEEEQWEKIKHMIAVAKTVWPDC